MPRHDIPTGTVTFLFTDVAGSTQLLHELGAEGYAAALAKHRRVVRAACVAAGGVEVDTQGDAFFIAFPTAHGALAAAANLTEALAAGPIRVRAGTHTGTPLVTEEGYVGPDVHRAARIAAVAHGGQVVVSSATAALVDPGRLQDLGEHRLKDLSAPQRIYQLGKQQFPPLNSLHQTNLPVPSTPFLGREKELGEVAALLLRDDVRLLTLTGPGGTGKTRLAAQAAGLVSDAHPDGVFWVPLAPLLDPELVLSSAAQALGAREGLAEHVGGRRMLILFDNFEQVVEAAGGLAELLSTCPNLDLLVTSREPLHLTGEYEYAVLPFAHEDGVRFFFARARAVQPAFEANGIVAAICRRLDYLPLALELAAARVKALTPEQILARLEHRLPLLTGGARDLPSRQRTLTATIEWSHELLSEEERRLFRRLSVFAGGCTLEAAEEIVGADLDTLQSLVDKSLLRHTEDRFWMLETIREYAVGQLNESDDTELRLQHAAYFLGRAGAEAREFFGRQQPQCLARLRADYDNYRAALTFFEEQGDADALLALASRLWRFWYMSSLLEEGGRWLDSALRGGNGRSLEYANALHGRSALFLFGGSFDEGEARQHEALRLFRELQHSWGIAEVLNDAGALASFRGDLGTADALFEKSRALAIEIAEPWLEALASSNLAESALRRGEFERATRLATEVLDLAAAFNDDDTAAHVHAIRGHARLLLGDAGAAEADLREAIARAQALGRYEFVAWSLLGIAAASLHVGDVLRAARLLGAVERWNDETELQSVGPEAALFHETVARIEARSTEDVANARAKGAKEGLDAAAAYALGED
jgi:predicted ATPase